MDLVWLFVKLVPVHSMVKTGDVAKLVTSGFQCPFTQRARRLKGTGLHPVMWLMQLFPAPNRSTELSMACTVAARGAKYSSASSPKLSPGPILASQIVR